MGGPVELGEVGGGAGLGPFPCGLEVAVLEGVTGRESIQAGVEEHVTLLGRDPPPSWPVLQLDSEPPGGKACREELSLELSYGKDAPGVGFAPGVRPQHGVGSEYESSEGRMRALAEDSGELRFWQEGKARGLHGGEEGIGGVETAAVDSLHEPAGNLFRGRTLIIESGWLVAGVANLRPMPGSPPRPGIARESWLWRWEILGPAGEQPEGGPDERDQRHRSHHDPVGPDAVGH